MLNPISTSVGAVSQPAQPPNIEAANNVFRVLHGFYGSLFFSKFASGETDGNGGDAGMVTARAIWAHGLRRYDIETVKGALARCLQHHPEYPPSFPQFVALCEACKPREVFLSQRPVIGMGQALRSRYAAQARTINQKHAQAVKAGATRREPPPGLDGLKQAIADAVATAGGDEADELRRLDAMFAGAGE